MIVEPDFLEHHKTRTLVELSGNEAAPLAVLRLWGHCQASRRWEFPDMTEAQLSVLCRWKAGKMSCHEALIESGFIKRMGRKKGFAAHQWEEKNGQLIQKWKVGKLGGRPKKGEEKTFKQPPKENRPITDREPDGLETETDRKPDGNRPKTDQTRSEKTRSEDHTPKSRSGGTGEGVEGGTPSGSDSERSGKQFEVPVFEPIAPGVFLRELREMQEAVRGQIRSLKGNPEAWRWEDREDGEAVEGIRWTVKEMETCNDPKRRERLEEDLKRYQGQRMKRIQVDLWPEAERCMEAWRKRLAEIGRAMTGARE